MNKFVRGTSQLIGGHKLPKKMQISRHKMKFENATVDVDIRIAVRFLFSIFFPFSIGSTEYVKARTRRGEGVDIVNMSVRFFSFSLPVIFPHAMKFK